MRLGFTRATDVPADAAPAAPAWYRDAHLVFLRGGVTHATIEYFDPNPPTALPTDSLEYVDHGGVQARDLVNVYRG